MIAIYILVTGIALISLSLFEFIMPQRAFRLWFRYLSGRAFFLHGLILIIGGLPLVMYRGFLSTIIFIIGVMVILMGPFILLYSEKIREMFHSVTLDLDQRGIRNLVYFDATVRCAVGILFIATFFY
jgi:hypothetical protein